MNAIQQDEGLYGPNDPGHLALRHHVHVATKTTKPSRERGTAVVEAALITPLVIAVLLGIFEAGWLMKANLSVEQAVSYSARVGTIAGSDVGADVAILDEIEIRLIDGRANVERVVIFKATSADTNPPPSCLTGTHSGSSIDNCTVYRPADFDKSAASLTCRWCPADRQGNELLGVWIRYEYPSLTGIYRGSTITSKTILSIEYSAGI